MLGENAGLLEITVGNLARGIVGGHNLVLDIFGEGHPPQHWGFAFDKDHTSHPWLGGVGGTEHLGVIRYYFGQSSGSLGDAACEEFEVVQETSHVDGDSHAVSVGMS